MSLIPLWITAFSGNMHKSGVQSYPLWAGVDAGFHSNQVGATLHMLN